jgi:hypothetical protein
MLFVVEAQSKLPTGVHILVYPPSACLSHSPSSKVHDTLQELLVAASLLEEKKLSGDGNLQEGQAGVPQYLSLQVRHSSSLSAFDSSEQSVWTAMCFYHTFTIMVSSE